MASVVDTSLGVASQDVGADGTKAAALTFQGRVGVEKPSSFLHRVQEI